MSKVGTYLNFKRETEEAFKFYQKVFGGKFIGGFSRFKDIPPQEGQPKVSKKDENLIMHVALPILGGHVLMGTDAPESMDFKLKSGNNVYINLQPDTKKEADRLFNKLSAGGTVEMHMQDMFWGDYYGSFSDKFGINWMIAWSRQK
jgi:PhnB protein